MGTQSKLEDFELCNRHIDGVTEHNVEMPALTAKGKCQLYQIRGQTRAFRNKSNGDLGVAVLARIMVLS